MPRRRAATSGSRTSALWGLARSARRASRTRPYRGGPLPSSTGRADPREVDRVIVDSESLPPDVGWVDPVVDGRIVHIEEPVAPPADEVVVTLRPGIDPGAGRGTAGLREDPKHHEGLQDAVDRGARHPRERVLDGAVYLVGGGVVRPPQEGLEDPAALRRDPYALGSAGRLELLYSDRLGRHSHLRSRCHPNPRSAEMGIGVLLNVSFGNMYQVHDIVKRYVRGTLCVNMNETLIPKEFRVEGENGLGTDLGRCSCNQIITLGSEQSVEFGVRYGERLRFFTDRRSDGA